MYTRLRDIPILELRDTQVDALYFNHVQVAHKRLGSSIRYRIPKLIHLDLILEPDAWIIVDRVLNDIAIAAWTDFETRNRANLHEPINCKLRLYHANANMILKRTLDAMEMLLGEQLMNDDNDFRVVPFPSPSSPDTPSG
ncbi:MAG: hypothetical protein PVJ39_10570 [Gammaproteobacteria bacterium]|jgi:hypothetical protein